jgi:flagellar basal body-associated protein FliL
MRATIFRILLLTAMLAALPLTRASADQSDSELPKTLPDWFNRRGREYYTMPAFVVPVIQGNDVTRQVTFLITLETMGTDNRAKLMSKRPQLQDGFLRDLYGVIALRPNAEVYDSESIKTRLRRVGDKVLGDGIIDDILVNVTYDRRVGP